MDSLPYFVQNGVMYGDRLMTYGDWVYIYGRKQQGGLNIPYVHVARAEVGSLEGPWEFYNGSEWVSDPASSAWLTFDGVSQQFAVFEHEGKFVLLSQDIWLSTEIFTMVADQPEGPWTNKTIIYDTPLPFEDMFTYNAYAHPQFDENNELLVSYNSNGSFWEIFNNVELYRPRFIRVPYEMIDASFAPSNIPVEGYDHGNGIQLQQNYPNPVSSITTVDYSLNENMFVSLRIYNLMGVELMSFINQQKAPGEHTITLNLDQLPSGIYYYSFGQQGRFLILE
jgi:hypothetical protein